MSPSARRTRCLAHRLALVLAVLTLWTVGGCPSEHRHEGASPSSNVEMADIPRRVGDFSDWTAVFPEFKHTCGLRAGGTLWCWGENYAGQIGDGTTTDRATPTRIGSEAGWVAAALGDHHTCARRDDGTVWCWGAHTNGYPAPRERIRNKTPEPVTLHVRDGASDKPLDVKDLATGDAASCVLDQQRRVACWGRGDRAGSGSDEHREDPVFLALPDGRRDLRFRAIALGSHHGCAVTTENAIWCWGDNEHGQLGDGSDVDIALSPVPVDLSGLPAGNAVSEVFAGTYHTCMLLSDHAVWCWGKGVDGQLGDGDDEDRNRPVPVDLSPLPQDRRLVSVDGGFSHTCALDDAGQAWCWGSGPIRSGASQEAVLRPAPVDMTHVPSGRFASLVTGVDHTCAIDVEGYLYCWGTSQSPKLGLGARP